MKTKISRFKTLLIVLVCLTISCKDKDPLQPCNCGIVSNNGQNTSGYYITVKNECTKNQENFYMSYELMHYYLIGDKYCSDVVDSW